MPSVNMEGDSDAQLMALVKQGDMSAFGRLYQKYGRFVDHAILSTAPTLDRSEVEDLCQDTFLEMRKGASKYREEGKLRAWIYSYAVRTTRGHIRKWAIRDRLLGVFKAQSLAVSGTVQTSPDVHAMVHLDLGQVLAELPMAQRQVLVLFEQDGLKGQEIAEVLGMNINTVWTHLRRARTTVNQRLHGVDANGGTS